MEIIQNFGIQWPLLVAQIINFLIIAYLLKRFAYKPILKMLQDRKATIAESLKNAELTEKKLQETIEKEKQILKKAQASAQQLLTDAQKQAADMLDQAEAKARQQSEKMLADASREIERQTKEAEKKLSAHTAQLAVSILEKALTGLFDEKDQKNVIQRAVKRLKE